MSPNKPISRRDFLRGAAVGGVGLILSACAPALPRTPAGIEKQSFGRAGHMSTRILFGGAAFYQETQDEADRVLELLLEYGINHIDTAASYGLSELRIGPWMERHRQDFFLATKTEQRTYQRAWDGFRRSLDKLQVDHVDLLQLHNLVDQAEWEVAMGLDGALEAAIEAREQGLVRFIGVTGHGLDAPAMHVRSLERFDFDSVLVPYNYPLMQNAQYAADFVALLAMCQERDVAVQAIKSVTRGPWGSRPKTYDTWYAPLDEQSAVDKAVHWVLGRPGLFLNTAADTSILEMVLDAAKRFRSAPSDEEMEALVTEFEMEPLWA